MNQCRILKIKVPKGDLHNDAMEEPFLKDPLFNLKDFFFFHFKEPFVQWNVSLDVKVSSCNHRCC